MYMPPLDSKIKVTENHKGLTITIPHEVKKPLWRAAAIFQAMVPLFISAFVIRVLVPGLSTAAYTDLLHPIFIIWLCIPTFIVVASIVQAFFIMRPGIPVKIKLHPQQLHYDSGIKPYVPLPRNVPIAKHRRNLVPKRARVTLNDSTISTLSLKGGKSGHQIIVEYRDRPVAIAPHISESDREWLYHTLTDYYCIGSSRRRRSV